MKQHIILAICALIILWLLASFIAWDINPGHWHETGRMLIAIGALAIMALLGLSIIDLGVKPKQDTPD